MSSSITGELITESLGYDGGRQVTVYVPPVAPEAVVFAGDGQLRNCALVWPNSGRVWAVRGRCPTLVWAPRS